MKAVVIHKAGDIRWQEVPDPTPPAGWVSVAVRSVGICSSDIGRALDGSAYHYPIVLGHEIGGVVAATGEGVDAGLAGKRVAVSPLIPCRKCEWCARGRYSMCDDYDYLGSRRDGGCAEFVIAPAENLVFLPDEVSMDDAGVLEPASVTLHGLDGRVQAGDVVLVLGAGNLGLFALQQARILGAGRVFVLDLVPYRLKVAEELGAIPILATQNDDGTQKLYELTNQRRADLVVDTCGVAAVQANALAMARKGGRIVYMGLPHQEVCITPKNFNWLVRCEVELYGSWNSFSAPYPGLAWHANVGYMAAGLLKSDKIITHRFEMKDAEKAYRMIREGREAIIKALLFNPD
jgi:L-iditol 2-dehydrogenase